MALLTETTSNIGRRRLQRPASSGQHTASVVRQQHKVTAARKSLQLTGSSASSSCLCCTCSGCCTCIDHNNSSRSSSSGRNSKTNPSERNRNGRKPMTARVARSGADKIIHPASAENKKTSCRGERIIRNHLSPAAKVQRNHQAEQRQQPFEADCAKCLLIARFTTTQARLAVQRHGAADHKATTTTTPTTTTAAAVKKAENESGRLAGREADNNSEISSLTASSLGGRNNNDRDADSTNSASNWSLSSCPSEQEKTDIDPRGAAKAPAKQQQQQQKQQRQLPLRSKKAKSAYLDGRHNPNHNHHRNKRRQAPLPPPAAAAAVATLSSNKKNDPNNNNSNNDYSRQSKCDRSDGSGGLVSSSRPAAPSVDSGNDSSETSRYCDEMTTATAIATASKNVANTEQQQHHQRHEREEEEEEEREEAKLKISLLNETEIYSIEHSLRSLKTSTYVCGCLANLYLTHTCLANNGRRSRPTSWQLSRTGVPVLSFDSGLARNRNKRRLCINLAERGSGFILWSDVIDHLSDYRAYSAEQLGGDEKSSSSRYSEVAAACDTFHVMYLSSNHRIMVGLSFDDAHCARLFLRQVELITSDPANIALTGPKRPLAKRTLASVGRLGQLLVGAGAGGSKQDKRSQLRSQGLRQGKKRAAAMLEEVPLPTAVSMGCLNASPSGGHRQSELMLAHHQRTRSTTKLGTIHTDGWSTLKRVMRFGGQRPATSRSDPPTAADIASVRDASAATPWLRPRPLASLAAAGRNFKRLPRKCDISAPCLFEHVTRVDSLNLAELYSRSLVSSEVPSPGAQLPAREQTAAGQSLVTTGNSEEPPAMMISTTNLHPEDHGMVVSRLPEQTTRSKESQLHDRSASSSCYSSASISPASSDESTNNADLRPSTPSMAVIRSVPPVPPIRRNGPPDTDRTTSAGRLTANSSHRRSRADQSEASSLRQDCPIEPTQGAKVKAIIRELQSQTSTDLVNAKRLLMADIAAQAAVRLSRSVSRL